MSKWCSHSSIIKNVCWYNWFFEASIFFLIKNAFVFDATLNEININVIKYIKWMNEDEKY